MDGPVPNNFLPLLFGSSFANTQPIAVSPQYSDTTAAELVQYVDCVSSFGLANSTLVVNGCQQAMNVQYVCEGASQYTVLGAMANSNGDIQDPALNVREIHCSTAVSVGCVYPAE
jgi:hypothetical protein